MLVRAFIVASIMLPGAASAQRPSQALAAPADDFVCRSAAIASDAPPEYPPAAARAKEKGLARVGVCVAPTGRAETVRFLSAPAASSQRLLEATAIWACRRTYEPARNGKDEPVRGCNFVVEHDWRLSDIPACQDCYGEELPYPIDTLNEPR
jgi:outer membrane biosynthesis protein TonB